MLLCRRKASYCYSLLNAHYKKIAWQSQTWCHRALAVTCWHLASVNIRHAQRKRALVHTPVVNSGVTEPKFANLFIPFRLPLQKNEVGSTPVFANSLQKLVTRAMSLQRLQNKLETDHLHPCVYQPWTFGEDWSVWQILRSFCFKVGQ